ncbi:MAG: segregation/condensation protein A [Thermoflexales bacterium]|nr:segregation/condensation protein A [Thermoflexales bacterium]MDW8350597.1 ScpA family protein [Anaerolineae bacterium]
MAEIPQQAHTTPDRTPQGAGSAPGDAPFSIHLPVYEGPLDVLLRLIEERRLEITEVSLAAIADQFIAYMSGMPRRDPRTLAHFIWVAARLILIKSRALLPQVVASPEEQEETDDLVHQLRAYQLYKHAAQILKAREQQGLRAYPVQPPPLPHPQSKKLPLDNVTLEALANAMQRVVNRWLPPPVADEMISRLTLTVNDCMDRIRAAVQARQRVTFTDMLEGVNTRVEVVVMLLALLELLRRYFVRCYQETLFGEIIIEHFPEAERPPADERPTPPEGGEEEPGD